jgi:hypothetical protein
MLDRAVRRGRRGVPPISGTSEIEITCLGIARSRATAAIQLERGWIATRDDDGFDGFIRLYLPNGSALVPGSHNDEHEKPVVIS